MEDVKQHPIAVAYGKQWTGCDGSNGSNAGDDSNTRECSVCVTDFEREQSKQVCSRAFTRNSLLGVRLESFVK